MFKIQKKPVYYAGACVAAVILAGTIGVRAGGLVLAQTNPSAEARTSAKPLIIAHRGGAADFPENTLSAIDQSLKAGADGEWLSIQATKDDVPVLYRPADLSALTDGSGTVVDKNVADLAGLNAGYNFRDAQGEYRYRTHPVGIPTLEEALDAIPEGKHIYLDLKQKDQDQHVVNAVVHLLNRKHAWDRVKLSSTDAKVTELLDGAVPDKSQVAESRDDTRQRLAEVALEHTCKSAPATWAGFDFKRQMTLKEKFTTGEGDSPITAQMWTADSVGCFESKGRIHLVMFSVNTRSDLATATQLGASAVLVDSPRKMIPQRS